MRLAILLLCLMLVAAPVYSQPADNPVNALTQDLSSKLSAHQDNLVFSPLSIECAMAALGLGARGETADELWRALHLSPDNLDQFGGQLREMTARNNGKTAEWVVANAVWTTNQEPPLPDYVARVKKVFGAEARALDFGQSEQARQTINSWVGQTTRQNIPELLPQGAIDASVRMVITNAVYFKASWKSQFDPKLTQNRPFRSPEGLQEVPTMTQQSTFGCFNGPGFQAVILPYADSSVVAVVALPDSDDGLKKLVKRFDSKMLSAVLTESEPLELRIWLPRFTLRSTLQLIPTFQALGVSRIFGNGDLSGLTGKPGLFVSLIVHQAFVEVNEVGTEASAATAVVITRSMPMEFKVDHPFLFMLVDRPSGTILFSGQVRKI
ncbi:MAG: serpin family protein [Candidatus Eremiobacteraeota bacterium]|nr:serpin family protein [Candidatus Eremiobacteraeota bacterium]